MDKKTKKYLGIGAAVVVIYLIWQNRAKFSADVDFQTPVGGVGARVGQGGISIGTNPAPQDNVEAVVDPMGM